MHVHVDKATSVGVGAAGVSATPTTMYGDWLTTHGVGVLSYAEWLQCLGGLYIAVLLGRMAWQAIRRNS